MEDLQSLTAQLALVTAAFQLQTVALVEERQLHAQTRQENENLRSEVSAPQQLDQHSKVLSLKQVVSLMYKEDSACVLIVRRIQKLGFRSVPVLREFFQLQGCHVRKTIVVHSRSKGAADPSKGAVRPANMAFVLMARPCDVLRALALGPTVAISDHRHVLADNVTLHPFVKHSAESTGESEISPDDAILPSGIL